MTESAALTRLRATGRIVRIDAPRASDDASGSCVLPSPETLDVVGPISLPVQGAESERVARWYVARPIGPRHGSDEAREEVSVLEFGNPGVGAALPLVRIHSACLTGDVLGSLRCDCGPQLEAAVELIAAAPAGGLLIYMMAHEGRGVGLWAKAAAYALQNEGMDTYAANRALGFDHDERDFAFAAALVRHFLGTRSFELLTNNPLKMQSLRRFGVTAAVRRSLIEGASTHNVCYLRAKRAHGHWLPG